VEQESNFNEMVHLRLSGKDYEVYKKTDEPARDIFLRGLYGKKYKHVRSRKKLKDYNLSMVFFGLGILLMFSTFNAFNIFIYSVFFILGFGMLIIGVLNFMEVFNAS